MTLTLHGPIPIAGFIEDGKITLTRPWLLVGPKPETVKDIKRRRDYETNRRRQSRSMKAFVLALAERVAAQSDLLSTRAEKDKP